MVSKLTENEQKKIYDIEPEIKLGKDFTINSKKKLGCGAFGVIYSGFNNKTKEEVAIKLESQKTPTPQLLYESKILKLLQGGTGIPTVYYTSTIGDHVVMIIDYLDKNLEELLNIMKENKFSLKTVLMIADQILSRIEYLHSKSIIHRDIKPENFLLGLKKKSFLIYLIDYGLAKRFKNPKTGEHIPFLEGKQLTGTARYASIYTQLGIEQSRRDDLESLGYILVYFMQGYLPWQGIKSKTKAEKYKKILEKKIKTVPVDICKDLPEEFLLYFQHVRSLQFDETPKYDYLKNIFKQLMKKNNHSNDFMFDWCVSTNIVDKKEAIKTLSNKSSEKENDFNIDAKNQKEEQEENLIEKIKAESPKEILNTIDDPERESIIINIDANETTLQKLNLEDKDEKCNVEKEKD